jgi:hypothetical protein
LKKRVVIAFTAIPTRFFMFLAKLYFFILSRHK